MTIIKRITAKGFKSFATNTEFLFGPRFNCIIGPNGSGKSNCADALCFVLGKSSAKGMRAERTANLIYNGGKQAKPAKEAEVTIEFDNSKATFPMQTGTIKITRIAKNNGTSIYKINNEVRTRQQIIELLNAAKLDPDGHNIILQGDITSFIEMKPVEKRMIIEEIAGISAYEDRKQKCLLELEKVDEKLNQAGIILAEREANLRELKKERDQAQRYKNIQQNIQENTATVIHLQAKDKETHVNEIESKLKEANEKIEKTNQEITQLKENINKSREEIKQINQEIEIKGEKEQLILRKEIEDLKTEIVKAASRLEVCQNEVQKINARKQQLQIGLREIENKLLDLQKEKIRHESTLKELEKEENETKKEMGKFREKHGVDTNAAKELENIEQEIENNQKELTAALEQKQELLRLNDQLIFKLNAINEKLNACSLNTPEAVELKEKRERFKQLTTQLNKHINEDSSYATQLYNLRQGYQNKAELLAKSQAKNAGVQEKVSGDNAQKEILKSKIPGIHGTVSSLGEVNQKYSLALEIAAGPRIMSVVVDNDETAQRCIQYLRENKIGVVNFLPLNKIKERQLDNNANAILKSKNKSIHGLAIDLVDFEPKYNNVFSYVFGDTIIVENIEEARKIGVGKARIVTLAGDLIEPSGAMMGGYRQPRRAHGFKEKELDSEIKKLEEEINKIQNLVSHVENKRAENENNIIRLRGEKAALEGSIIRIEKSLQLPEDERTALEGDKDKLEKELKKNDIQEIIKTYSIIEKTLSSLKTRKQKIREALNDQGIMQNLETLQQSLNITKEKILEARSEVKNIEMQMQKVYLPDKEKTTKILKEQEKDHENFTNEISDLNEMLKQRQSTLKGKEKEEEKFHSNIKDMALKREKITEKIQAKENDIARLDEKNRAQQLASNEISIERARIIAELEGLQKQFEPFKDAKLKRGLSVEQLKTKILEAQKDLEVIGNVNLRAFDVYETIEKEHAGLVEKTNKLKLEKGDVLNMMAEIETKKKDIFMKTYNAIVSRFKSIFLSLSTKGEAQVALESPENPFEGGMDIEIKITGSKYLDVKGLSGGEKTMAALAFIFAIQEYSPSPFYLLDEVDAALDRTNSALLTQLIKKYSEKAQYIVISHNDTIINDADLLYGVSMKDGISKVVGLKI